MLLERFAVRECALRDANVLLREWDHPLGECNRPFGSIAHVWLLRGHPIACSVAASAVSPTVERYARTEVVDLARIGRHPDFPWVMRPWLRVWRAELAFDYQRYEKFQPIIAAVSYSLPGKAGHVYRHDGWRFVKWCKKASPGPNSGWANASATDSIEDGRKGLWIYDYPEDERVPVPDVQEALCLT